MLYQVIHHIPGRVRLSIGRGLLSDAQARGLSELLGDIPGVNRVRVNAINGSILIEHEPSSFSDICLTIERLSLVSIPECESSAEIDVYEENNRFYREVLTMFFWRYMRKTFLPAPIGNFVIAVQGIYLIIKGLRELLRARLNVEVLDATAIAVSLMQRSFASAGSVMFMLRLSDAMEQHAQARTRIALEESLLVRVNEVWFVDETGQEYKGSIDQIALGDVIRIHSGMSIPVDGYVVTGDAEINESSLTGESRVVHKHAGSSVYASTVIEDGTLDICVSALPGSSRIDEIVRMVEESSNLKASIQSQAEGLADRLVPLSLSLALGTYLLTRDIIKASSVLMVDYSCAIKLTTPIAVMSAMREASDTGAIIKGGKYLEALAQADVVVFDKTGTLTSASPKVQRIIALNPERYSQREVLRLAACLEEHFPHSIARAIVKAAEERGLLHDEELHSKVEYVVAHGIVSYVNNQRMCIGSAHFIFDDEGVVEPENLDDILAECGAVSTVFVACEHELIGIVCIEDPLRPEAKETIDALKACGISTFVMLTGDAPGAAHHVAEMLGIDTYHAQVLPEDKAYFVEELKSAGHKVIMIGDGINDSPALASSDVSITLSDASEIARAVADVVLLDSNLRTLVKLKTLSQKLMERISQDYRFIVSFNTSLIALGILGIATPEVTAFLHNASTVAVTGYNTRPLLRERRRASQSRTHASSHTELLAKAPQSREQGLMNVMTDEEREHLRKTYTGSASSCPTHCRGRGIVCPVCPRNPYRA